MSKVDTTGWKQFRLVDLGFVCYHGCRLNKSERIDGNLLFLTAGKENMGAYGYIGNNRDAYSEAISVDMFGNCFYHRELCAGDDNVYFFVNAQVSSLSKQFIATCIDAYCRNMFSYSRQFRQPDADDLVVFLPATPDGQPDWAYMDAYMSEVLKKEEVFAEHLASLTAEAVADGHKLDTSGWKAFRIGELFEKLSLGFKAGRKFDKALDVSTEPSDEFDLPLVNAKDGNNGVMYWGRSMDWDSAEMTLDIVQNGAVATGNVYAQPQRTGVLFDAYLVKPKFDVSVEILQFLAVVIQKSVKQHFSYFNKCTWDRVSGLFIYLPVTSDGQPDWAWMEQYMQQQMDKAEALVEHLDAVWN